MVLGVYIPKQIRNSRMPDYIPSIVTRVVDTKQTIEENLEEEVLIQLI